MLPQTSVFFYLILCILLRISRASDVFCGNLTVFEQQRFGSSVQILSQDTPDLKECLRLCCEVINCNAVTFIGIVSSKGPGPNCLLISCPNGDCEATPKELYEAGVISVKISRDISQLDIAVLNVTSPPAPSPEVSEGSFSSPTLVPVWSVGLGIVIGVVCIGLILSLLSAYICYRRKQSKKQTAHISTKGPTLHAYNPPL